MEVPSSSSSSWWSLTSVVGRLESLVREARWLDAVDELEAFEESTGRSGGEELDLFTEVRSVGRKFRAARAQCEEEGGGVEWESGYSYLGIDTSFRYDEAGMLWLKTEGDMRDINLFYTVAVLREVELFGEWVPFLRHVRALKWLDLSRCCTHFSIGVRGILVRDCLLRCSACNSALTEGALYFEGESPDDDADSWAGVELPKRTWGFAFDRMRVAALNARVKFTSPNEQRCTVIVAVDLRLHVPRTLLDFFLKRLVGIFLALWRRQARRVARDPDCPHRRAIDIDDPAFYRDFLYVKYLEFLNAQGWDRPDPPEGDHSPRRPAAAAASDCCCDTNVSTSPLDEKEAPSSSSSEPPLEHGGGGRPQEHPAAAAA